MASKPKPAKAPPDGLTQSERFIEAARRHETDDDPERFREMVKRLAKVKPPVEPSEAK